MTLTSSKACYLLHSIKIINLKCETLGYNVFFLVCFAIRTETWQSALKDVKDNQDLIFHVRTIFKKTNYAIFIQIWRNIYVLYDEILEVWTFELVFGF
jgi:hypothetical protein